MQPIESRMSGSITAAIAMQTAEQAVAVPAAIAIIHNHWLTSVATMA